MTGTGVTSRGVARAGVTHTGVTSTGDWNSVTSTGMSTGEEN